MEGLKLPLTYEDISKLLPHRYPFLMIDRIVEFEDNDYLIGYKNVTINEQFFVGHFPSGPILPGVMIIEAIAQMGVLFAKLCSNGIPRDSLIVLAGCDKVRFKRQVFPGDRMFIKVSDALRRANYWVIEGVAEVEEEIVATGIFRAYKIKTP